MPKTTLIWLRNDLRIADNPALRAATGRGGTVVAIHVNETDPTLRQRGAASRWWLHQSLDSLSGDLARRGILLDTLEGAAEVTVLNAVARHGAEAVVWNRRYAPAEREIDAAIKRRLADAGIAATSYPGNVLVEPFDIETKAGFPYGVFTPFWNALRARDIGAPVGTPEGGSPLVPQTVDRTYVTPPWAGKLARHWSIGEAPARERLMAFLDDDVAS